MAGHLFLINMKCPPELEPGDCVYRICRPTALGNPYPLRAGSSQAERDRCVERYGQWLERQVAEGNPRVLGALAEIEALLADHDVGLECYCVPQRCHGEMVIEMIRRRGAHAVR